MKQKTIIIYLLLAVSILLCACGTNNQGTDSISSPENKDIYIATRFCSFTQNKDGAISGLDLGFRVENYTLKKIIQINYDVVISDSLGTELKRISSVTNMQDSFIKSKSNKDFERNFLNLDIQGVGDKKGLKVDIVLTGLVFTSDMKPISNPEIVISSDTVDNVTVTLNSIAASFEGLYGTGFVPDITVTNNSEKDIIQVDYELILMDRDGNVLDKITRSFNGVDKAIHPGESSDEEYGKSLKILNSQVSHVSVKLLSVTGTDVKPVAFFPMIGEKLYLSCDDVNMKNISSSLPVCIDAYVDNSGNVNLFSITDTEKIKQAVNLFKAVNIKGDGMSVTDAYNMVVFTFANGSTYSISLPGNYLEIGNYGEYKYYELENFDLFWDYLCN